MSNSALSAPHAPTPAEFREVQKSPEFAELKKTYRAFTFPMSIAFFVWYLLYLITAVSFPDFMRQEVAGNINMGLILGVLQFITTFAITWVYVVYANKRIEPQSAAIREQMEYPDQAPHQPAQ